MRPTRDFWDQALCAQTGGDLFFLEYGDGNMRDARRICRMCDVQERCLEWALSLPAMQDAHGMYGGLSPRERNKIRTQRKEAA